MASILLVEDDASMLRVLSMWLQRHGHQVTEANNGLRGQEELRLRAVDIVVSDVNMPGLDGISLTRWLRTESDHNQKTPVILLSSRSDRSVMANELEPLGVEVYPKPFSPSRLVAEVEKRLQQCAEVASGEREAASP